ncbi:formylglycine-generating enzyme family protein [Sphingomonas sp. AR_OL41]|uniref:formylglycine-generating enzyme family protein n=1 Tax=Sphingomonas sp. AR_OL41 TaxID=3042729 RepID=UPI0024807FA9|nr:formylglycine-generating enzyme family protein [Sphingomonas sp. AR_OL41]MDH7973235.1 formylglycine-generating enzyme family protein [Sphingomonas sp. AR_OL41]
MLPLWTSLRLIIASLGLCITLILPLPAMAEAATPATGGATLQDCADCPTMVTVPAGTAMLGSTAEERARVGIVPLFGDREGPRYRVTFAQPYAIGRTEVTRGEYRVFVDATGRPDPASCGVHEPKADSWSPQPGFTWRKPGFAQDDRHPAVCISYDDAVAYTVWLSKRTGKAYRLPSDAEWEYAARGGTETTWYWGDAPEVGCATANLLSAGTVAALGWPKSLASRMVCADQRSFTVPVASYPPNPFGLYDMAGNAFEWAADCNNKDNSDAHADGAPRTGTVCDRHYLKGGAFHTPFWLTRPAVRGAPIPADLHMFAIGFRIARSLP